MREYLGTRDAAILTRYARRCAWSVVAFAAACAPSVANGYEAIRTLFYYHSPLGDLRAEAGQRYLGIVAMEWNALVFLLAIGLPCIAAAVLFYVRHVVRARP